MNNKEFNLKGTIKKGVSQKGNEYEYLDLKLVDGYSKRIFLEEAEKILLLSNEKNISSSFDKLIK